MGNISSDLKGPPGPVGPQGKIGPTGPPGPAGTPDTKYFKTNSMWCANGEICDIGGNGINFASKSTGQEKNAGHIAYRKIDKNALDIVGAGITDSDRKVKIWDHLDVNSTLTVNGQNILDKINEAKNAAGTKPGPEGPRGPKGDQGFTGTVTANSGILVEGKNTIRMGDKVTKEQNAGVIGYQTFSNSLDIVGAGTDASSRTVRIWDKLVIGEWEIYQEGDRLRVRNQASNIAYDFHKNPAGHNNKNVWVNWGFQ